MVDKGNVEWAIVERKVNIVAAGTWGISRVTTGMPILNGSLFSEVKKKKKPLDQFGGSHSSGG